MADGERLDGWREIAAYLHRDERTAKRWEKLRGLPVRRIPGEGRPHVYALRQEVDAWMEGGAATEQAGDGREDDPLTAEFAADASAGEPGERRSGERTVDLAGDVADGEESAVPEVVAAPAFRWTEHVSLAVSALGLLVLLAATAVRFFHVGPLERILFASERRVGTSIEPAAETRVGDALYLRGMYLCEARTPGSLEAARVTFLEAIAKDPEYAPSYGGLAKAYLLLREYSTQPDDQAYMLAEQAAAQGLALDPELASAHAAMGFIHFFRQNNAAGAEQDFGLAMRAEPRDALAHHWYGSMLMHQGRFQEAMVQLDAAQHLDPASTAIVASRALAMGYSGHRDEGMQQLETIESTGHEVAAVHRDLANLSLLAPRDTGRFLREMALFAGMRGDTESKAILQRAAETNARRGETAMWEQLLRDEGTLRQNGGKPTYLMAVAEAALGRDQAAMQVLEQLATTRDGRLMGMMIDPTFAGLHRNAEFLRIAEEMGLEFPAMAMR